MKLLYENNSADAGIHEVGTLQFRGELSNEIIVRFFSSKLSITDE